MEKELKRYYRSISICLPVSLKRKYQIVRTIRQSVENYRTEHPDADMNEILENIGKPQEIAASYVENMTTPELLRKLRVRRILVAIVGTLASIILLSWLTVVAVATINILHASEGFTVIYPAEEIDSETFPTQ